MAGCSVELLAVLTGAVFLLLGSVRGWERINETELLSLYKSGHLDKAPRASPPDQWKDAGGAARKDDSGFYELDYYDDEDDDDDGPSKDFDFAQTIIGSSLPTFDSVGESDLVVEGIPELSEWPGSSESDFQEEFEGSFARSWRGSSTPDNGAVSVVCRRNEFQITISDGLLKDVKILGSKGVHAVMEAPEVCGYGVNPDENTFTVPFTGCHVKESERLSQDAVGHTPSQQKSNIQWLTVNCAVPMAERLTCGPSGISPSDCDKKGCCMDKSTRTCYYPIDECTVDQHFVFAIRSSGAVIPVDPTQLIIPGHPNCKPVIANSEFAIYKFSVNECGARVYEVGQTRIYLTEVQTVVRAYNLKYGIITRSDPLRFLVECRYSKCATAKQSLASVGYMVKTPTSSLPSSILSNGLYGVQLRIARDRTYSSYFPSYHQPLKLLLGKPVFLELNLKSPKPDAVLLVNYCLAYPRSAKNALVLIFEGCANPNDPHVSILKVSDAPKNRNRRRFTVDAFQFMRMRTNEYLDEEIYFMCSTEVCWPTEKTCEERCFDGKVH
ncbi:zona pellucida sperm-binding protein 4-like [Salarias fasciatus]|uniref:zona pellucida sperm-binding protein 4-like n=1 Tax=Salarias fasciatus TaxID=181472 RepID=UPI001176ECDD|nr:zona pellucida sperm-binding protein 4-like [Salarias fasciatus]